MTTTDRCDTCYFWFKGENIKSGWGECQKAEAFDDAPTDQETKAFAFTTDSLARLLTLPDFGCVMWEAPPEEMPF